MAEIHVIFPSEGEPIVRDVRKATLWDEIITWHVLNKNPAVKKVKIAFEREEARFFPIKDRNTGEVADQHQLVKDLPAPPETVKGDGWKTSVTIWGVAPNLGPVKGPDDPIRRKLDKYTVSGLDASGEKTIVALDPQIVNSDPNDP